MFVGKIPTAWGGWDYRAEHWAKFYSMIWWKNDDMIQVKALLDTSTTVWLDELVKITWAIT